MSRTTSNLEYSLAATSLGADSTISQISAHEGPIIDTILARVLVLLVLEAAILRATSEQNQPAIQQSQSDHQKMEQTLRQLGELLLASVPTVILLWLLYIVYVFVVHRPLTAVLAERQKRTQGAMEKARADIAAAEARTADYEQRLREARQKVFKSLEARRQQATEARSAP